MIWMPGKHVHGDVETITRLVDIVMARVRPGSHPATTLGAAAPM